jgi:hypothetical protein
MRKEFNQDDVIARLLWSDRHCCICGKACGVNIEIAHIEDSDNYDIDNAVPACFDCHLKIGHYNDKHPLGKKFSAKEIKRRREQIYDKHTREYLVPIQYKISDLLNPTLPNMGKREYPDITFNIINMSESLPTQLKIILRGILNGEDVDLELDKGHYTGDKLWNMNPRMIVNGHFEIHNTRLRSLSTTDRLDIRVSITQIDMLKRAHQLLEDGYSYNSEKRYWYFEP